MTLKSKLRRLERKAAAKMPPEPLIIERAIIDLDGTVLEVLRRGEASASGFQTP